MAAIHDRSLRRIRDLAVFERPVELRVPRLRLACPVCGPRLQRLTWLDPWRVVKRSHWLLLRNPAKLKASERIRLAEVLDANQSLLAYT